MSTNTNEIQTPNSLTNYTFNILTSLNRTLKFESLQELENILGLVRGLRG